MNTFSGHLLIVITFEPEVDDGFRKDFAVFCRQQQRTAAAACLLIVAAVRLCDVGVYYTAVLLP